MSPTERQRQERLDTAFGEWVRERLAAQKPDRWTQQRLRDELAQRGHEVKREWVNQVINGKHASDDLRKAVEAILGTFPEPVPIEPATADLAAALIALAEELRLSRESRADLERRLAALEPVVARLAEQALEGSPARSAPAVTAG